MFGEVQTSFLSCAFLVGGFHGVIDEVLIVEGFLEIPIYAGEVGV